MAAYGPSDLASLLQTDLDTASAVLALKVAADTVHTYTRGAGFDPITGDPGDDLAGVILLVASRLYANPEMVRSESLGGWSFTSATAGFQGFTLAEQSVLNTYRRRSA